MSLGEGLFLGLVAGAALAIAWEIWGELVREHVDALPGAIRPAADAAGGANLVGDVEQYLRDEGY
jgi:hypothetical protein